MNAAIGLVVTLLALVGAVRIVLAVYRTARAIPRALARMLARLGRALAKLDARASAPAMAREVSLADVAALAASACARAPAAKRGKVRA